MDGLWKRGDPWDFESSEYERGRCAHLLQLIEGRRYARTLEIGCGAGYLTRQLASLADQILALDISQTAIDRARTLGAAPAAVDFRVGNIMEYKPEADGPWDLIVFTDTICYLGWRYSFFDVAWFARQMRDALARDGRLLMANTMNPEGGDYLLLPFATLTYRDLFKNVGFRLEKEDRFTGARNGVEFQVVETLFSRGD